MTVVEAFIGRKKINPPDDSSQMHSIVIYLLSEGIAQNTTGNVFVPKVNVCVCVCVYLHINFHYGSKRKLCIYLFRFSFVGVANHHLCILSF